MKSGNWGYKAPTKEELMKLVEKLAHKAAKESYEKIKKLENIK